MFHIACWHSIIYVKLNEPENNININTIEEKTSSYESSCAVALIAPTKGRVSRLVTLPSEPYVIVSHHTARQYKLFTFVIRMIKITKGRKIERYLLRLWVIKLEEFEPKLIYYSLYSAIRFISQCSNSPLW
jgi:hypothetical protein